MVTLAVNGHTDSLAGLRQILLEYLIEIPSCELVEGVLSFEDVSGAEAWVAKREEGGNREGKQAKPGEAPGRATDCRRLRKSAFLYPGWGKTLTSAYVVGKDSKA